jgi:translation initiation factor 2 alpha subunit (eIF-2alpha)
MNKAREDKKVVDKYIPKEFREAVIKVIDKKKKQIEMDAFVELRCMEEDGIKRIKEIFDLGDGVKVVYIAAGKFNIKLKADDYKQGKRKLQEVLAVFEKSAKKASCDFNIKEGKQ